MLLETLQCLPFNLYTVRIINTVSYHIIDKHCLRTSKVSFQAASISSSSSSTSRSSSTVASWYCWYSLIRSFMLLSACADKYLRNWVRTRSPRWTPSHPCPRQCTSGGRLFVGTWQWIAQTLVWTAPEAGLVNHSHRSEENGPKLYIVL